VAKAALATRPLTASVEAATTLLGLPEPNDIIEWCLSDRWLNRPNLYPRQGTLLKIIFLQDELFTQFDHDVIGEWTEGFTLGDLSPGDTTQRYDGDWGIPPDIYERIRICKAEDRPYFRQVFFVGGRRGSKGHIGGICGARVLWHFMAMGDPRSRFGVDRDKRLSAQVFAGKKLQARDNQWRDIVNMIMGGPCFAPWIESSLGESLTVRAPIDRERLEDLLRRGVPQTQMDLASFELVPKEATTMAARGPAAFMQYFDEGAHMVATGVSRSMADVYDAATPALDQFKEHAFLYSGSSPWTMDGKFYELVEQTLSVEADTGEPVYPSNLMIQLPSWDIYDDWERAHTLIARPGWERPVAPDKYGPILGADGQPAIEKVPELRFGKLVSAIQTYDAAMQKLERANPDTFAVERRAKWATAMDAYLPQEHVKRMFSGWPTPQDTLVMEKVGSPTTDYVMHGDPGKTGSNFGFAVAHKIDVPGSEFPHVVFDFIKAWQPGDFDPMEMNYLVITEEIGELIDGFMPTDVTFDQWNSISMIQTLQQRSNMHFKRAQVYERNATAPLNWRTAETFKTALSLNLVHAPYYELAELECKFLRKMPGDKVDHPDTGPCTTKDVYDAMSICVFKLLGEEVAAFLGQQLGSLELQGMVPGLNGNDPNAHILEAFSAFSGQSGGPTRPSPARSGAPVVQPGRASRTPGSPRVPRQPQRRR